MEWYFNLALIFGLLVLMLLTGMPVAFCFLFVSLALVLFMWGGAPGIRTMVHTIVSNLAKYSLLPLPLFILMGSVIFHSGIAPNMISALDKWLGRFPGRLSFLAVGGGTLLATLTGSAMGSVAILGSTLVPEMEKRGYKPPMTVGPILGSCGLAIMIPPSVLGVLIAAIAKVSVGKVLIGIIIPGLLMAVLYATYIIIRCWLQPHLAPPYDAPPSPLSEKLLDTVKYILPVGFIIFMVIGLILLGVATPTEAAASGTLGAFILAAAYRRLNWEVLRTSLRGSLEIAFMTLMIIAAAESYGQLLGFSGASQGLADFIVNVPVGPIFILIGMQLVGIFLGMFTPGITVMVLTIPVFMPAVHALGFDPVWFIIILLLNVEMAQTSPPFGFSLFVMKGVASPDTTMGDIYRGAIPFLIADLVAIGLIIAFPSIALWLPSIMR